jgi:hypothetical protein
VRKLLPIAVALAVSGCTYGNWGHIGTGGPREPIAKADVLVQNPRLSPDGKAILFAFKYKQYPWKIGMVPSDPAATGAAVIKLPPMMDWVEPNWAPDNAHFAVVSYCMHDNCYEGAKGVHVWLTAPQDNLKRLTPDVPEVRRANPMFGADAGDVYWILSSMKEVPGARMDLHNRFVAHMEAGRETVLFPDTAADGSLGHGYRDPANLVIVNARGAGRFDAHGYYFTAMVERGDSDAAKAAVKQVGFLHSALLRYADGKFELVEPAEIEFVDAPRGGAGYVAEANPFVREHKGSVVSDFRIVQGGQTAWSFRFDAPAYDLSVSDDLKTVVFIGERGHMEADNRWIPKLESSLFLRRQGMSEAVDLNLPERLKAQVEKEIEAENQARVSGGPPHVNPLTGKDVFAVDKRAKAVQD